MDILRHILFENPLATCIVLALVALGAGTFWSRTGSRRARSLAVASCAAAAGLVILSWAVETDRERIERTLRRMSDAAARGDADAFVAQISAEYEGGPQGREIIVAVVRTGLRYVRASAEDPAIVMAGNRATVTQAYRFYPAPNARAILPPDRSVITWEGVLAPDPDGQWRLRSALATKPERMTPQDASRMLMKLATQM